MNAHQNSLVALFCGGNAHDRRKAARAHLHAARKQREKTEAATLAVWTPIGLAIGAPAEAACTPPLKGAFEEGMAILNGFQFIEGASVRNMRTKSVATMLRMGEGFTADSVHVLRRDNHKVWWLLSECENWNL